MKQVSTYRNETSKSSPISDFKAQKILFFRWETAQNHFSDKLLVGPIACTACLAVGYAVIEQWVGLVVVAFALPAWILARQKPDAMPPTVPLLFSTGIAANGLLAGAAPLLMILGAALALASWDMLLHHSLTGSSSSSATTIGLFEKRHFQYLALALGPGLLVPLTGRSLHFRVPFGIMLLLAIIILFGLDRILRTLIDVR